MRAVHRRQVGGGLGTSGFDSASGRSAADDGWASRFGMGHAQRALAAGADEGDDLLDDRMVRELLLDVVEALHQRAFVGKQQPVGAAQAVDVLAREAAPLQADDVEARTDGRGCRAPCRRG